MLTTGIPNSCSTSWIAERSPLPFSCRSRAIRTPAGSAPAGKIAPQFLRLLPGAIDEGVDGLAADRPQTTLGTALKPAGDLFGRPAFGQAIANEARQRLIPLNERTSLSTQKIGAVGVTRRIVPLG